MGAHLARTYGAVPDAHGTCLVRGVTRCAAEEGSRESCDSQCRKLTASWVREAKANSPDIETCQFYEGLESAGAEGVMDAGV